MDNIGTMDNLRVRNATGENGRAGDRGCTGLSTNTVEWWHGVHNLN